MPSLSKTLSAAIRLQVSGQPAAALAIYRVILAQVGDHADAWRLAGLALRALGDGDAGWRCLRTALALHPASPEAWVNLAAARRTPRPDESALAAYRHALALRPDFAEAYDGLAATLLTLNRAAEALDSWRRGIAACPTRADLGNALGNALQNLNEPQRATAAYRMALCIDPAHAAAWANCGAALRSPQGENAPAPGPPTLRAARRCQQRALRVQPGFPAASDGLGQTWLRLDRPGDAIPHHHRAIALQPDFAGAYANLGNAHLALNQPATTIAAYRRAIALNPALPDPHRNLGMALLLDGQMAEGWPEYEWRLACSDCKTPPIPRPRWNGEPLNGRVILLHAEQGLGDALHFVRYVPLAAARGGRVVLCAAPALERLVAGMAGVERFVPGGQPFSLAGIDVHAPLLSLPYILGTTPATLPAPVAYLAPDLALTAMWKRRLAALSDAAGHPARPGLRVGVVWAGSPTHGNDRNRSLPLDALLPLTDIPGVRLVSLQKGPAADELAQRALTDPRAAAIVNPAADIADFADTAAIMAGLDLALCVDTSVAHLAGALGRPVWVMLPFAPDWRWMLHRSDNPWYPTLRLFRQTAPDDWEPVLAAVHAGLRNLTGS